MSQENIEIVRRLSEEFSRGSVEAIRPFLHPDIIWHEDPSFPEAGTYRGSEAVVEYMQSFIAEFSEIHYEVGECIDAGVEVIANMEIRGSGKTSGAAFEISAWWALTIRDGMVFRGFAYLDRDRALQAAGLSE
jgi:ketosteroid isomerase-like protein